eukprot:gene5324-2420_t
MVPSLTGMIEAPPLPTLLSPSDPALAPTPHNHAFTCDYAFPVTTLDAISATTLFPGDAACTHCKILVRDRTGGKSDRVHAEDRFNLVYINSSCYVVFGNGINLELQISGSRLVFRRNTEHVSVSLVSLVTSARTVALGAHHAAVTDCVVLGRVLATSVPFKGSGKGWIVEIVVRAILVSIANIDLYQDVQVSVTSSIQIREFIFFTVRCEPCSRIGCDAETEHGNFGRKHTFRSSSGYFVAMRQHEAKNVTDMREYAVNCGNVLDIRIASRFFYAKKNGNPKQWDDN